MSTHTEQCHEHIRERRDLMLRLEEAEKAAYNERTRADNAVAALELARTELATLRARMNRPAPQRMFVVPMNRVGGYDA